MIVFLFGRAGLGAQAADGLLEGTDGVVRDQVAPVRPQLALPPAAFLTLQTMHAQLPHRVLSERLRGQLGERERLAADWTVGRSALMLRQTFATHNMGCKIKPQRHT